MCLDIVIVTYNRLEKLKKALQCYENQTRGFRNLIVVDNCSTDGTREWLDEWGASTSDKFNKKVIHAEENLGGSGGFYLGQKKAMELGADWVFVADDDAYAKATMIGEFCSLLNNHDCSKVSAICGTVRNTDGSIDIRHRDRFQITDKKWPYQDFLRYHVDEDEYRKDFFPADFLSYVGSFLNCKALKRYGLVNPKYFIYQDDTEHSLRLKKYGGIIVVPKIEIVHDGGITETRKDMLSWREYYNERNKIHMLLRHYPRTVIDVVFYEFRRIIGRHIHKHPANEADILRQTATMDAVLGRLGKHSKYKPGWEKPVGQLV